MDGDSSFFLPSADVGRRKIRNQPLLAQNRELLVLSNSSCIDSAKVPPQALDLTRVSLWEPRSRPHTLCRTPSVHGSLFRQRLL